MVPFNEDRDSTKRVDIKRRLRKNVILSIIKESSPISISEISVQSGFNLPVTTSLVEELQADDILKNVGLGKSTGGRPPVLYKINPDSKYVIGVDVGRSTTSIVLIDLEQNKVNQTQYQTVDLKEQKEEFIEQFEKEVSAFIKESKVPKKKILGIGVAFPGLVMSQKGRALGYLDFGEDKPIAKLLNERLGVLIRVENDARAMAMGEKYFGACKNSENALCVNLGWGIGLGIIINHQIYSGHHGFAGEFGHIVIEENGPLCHCGKRGCLEVIASGSAIARKAKNLLRDGHESMVLKMVNGHVDQINTKLIVKAARKGDLFSIEILEEIGNYIGKALAILINIFSPEKIVIGGSVSLGGKFLLDPIQTSARRMAYTPLVKDLKVETSKLDHFAGALGATTLITRDIFETQHLDLSPYI